MHTKFIASSNFPLDSLGPMTTQNIYLKCHSFINFVVFCLICVFHMLVVNSLNVDCEFQLLSCCMNRPQNHGVKMMKLLEKKKK